MNTMTSDPLISISRRPVGQSDLDFLQRLYGTTRYDLVHSGLSKPEQDQFVAMQFQAQHIHYQNYFKTAVFDLISLDQQPIGRIYVDERSDEIRLIDIALLPEYRKLGIGGAMIRELMERSVATGLPLRLRVEKDNQALRLYQRLGFKAIADEGVNLHLEWIPEEQEDG